MINYHFIIPFIARIFYLLLSNLFVVYIHTALYNNNFIFHPLPLNAVHSKFSFNMVDIEYLLLVVVLLNIQAKCKEINLIYLCARQQ